MLLNIFQNKIPLIETHSRYYNLNINVSNSIFSHISQLYSTMVASYSLRLVLEQYFSLNWTLSESDFESLHSEQRENKA
eukprot:m.218059 g.218059  ORF g.218059 m.218059 type:complete len:79 (-) comp15898_c0_seq6:94-330(-)